LLYELFHSQTHGGRLGDAGFALTETIALCNGWWLGVLYISGGLFGRVSVLVEQLTLSQGQQFVYVMMGLSVPLSRPGHRQRRHRRRCESWGRRPLRAEESLEEAAAWCHGRQSSGFVALGVWRYGLASTAPGLLVPHGGMPWMRMCSC
jgi:hypothetical protein